jgi:hypothetical protein
MFGAPRTLGTANVRPFRQFPPRLPFSFFPLGILQGVCSACHTRAPDTRLALTSADLAPRRLFCDIARSRSDFRFRCQSYAVSVVANASWAQHVHSPGLSKISLFRNPTIGWMVPLRDAKGVSPHSMTAYLHWADVNPNTESHSVPTHLTTPHHSNVNLQSTTRCFIAPNAQ